MPLPFGKRKADSEPRRSTESSTAFHRTTSESEWLSWLTTIRNFTGAVGGANKGDVRPFLKVILFGETFRALADTGAGVNLLGARVAKLLQQQGVEPDRAAATMKMADGSSCEAGLLYHLSGIVAGVAHSWDAYYIPNLSYDLILGMRCLEELNLVQIKADVVEPTLTNDLEEHNVNALDALSPEEDSKLAEFLERELPKFNAVAGKTTLLEHSIRLKENVVPTKQRYYPRNPAMQAIIDEEVDSMLREGVIEPSTSPWSSPVVLIKKTTGKYRFCIDMRCVNDASIKDAYPLPRINGILEKLRQAKYISTLDLKSGYWQVPLDKESRPITAFTVPGRGLFQFTVMPFGLHSAGATFQRLLDKVIGVELEPKAFAYLDDLVVVSSTFEEHLKLLEMVFRRLRDAGLKLNPEKCHFCKRQLKYLGHVVNYDGIATDPEKVQSIQEFPTPSTAKKLRSFLGLASWYRRFIANFATVSAPLRHLLKKNVKWLWGAKQEAAFQQLKELLSSSPVLACPDFSKTFTLQVDASNFGLGAALTQEIDGKEVVIAYASRLLTDQECNYSTTEKECLALVWAVRKFKPYLEGYHFVAITDHVALSWLMKLREPSGRLARWVMELQQHDFEIRYRKGTLNRVADALSRNPVGINPNDLGEDDEPTPAEVAALNDKGDKGDEPQSSSNAPIPVKTTDKAPADDSTQVTESWYDRMFRLVTNRPQRYSNFCIRAGQLYRSVRKDSSKNPEWKMCVPPDQVQAVLNENHDLPTAGHLGVKKSTSRVATRYFWPGWRRDVKLYVRSCPQCQAYKVAQTKPAGKMYFRRPKGPWTTISVDLIGPLPRSRYNHRFLVVLQDTFSKWTELAPIGAATAKNVSNKLKAVLLRYGAPETMICDNGTQFVSKIVKELAREWCIQLQTTAPYSPQSNPVERPNRVVKTMIAQYVKDNHKAWDLHLDELQFAMNTAEHDSTGFSPAMLCFGRELKLPRAICGPTFETTDNPNARTLGEVHEDRTKEFKRLYDKTHRNLKAAYERQSKYYNLRRREVVYEVGDLVLRRTHVLSSAADAVVGKLAPKFEGPCTIIGRRGVNIYEIEDCETKTKHVSHVKDLKPYHTRADIDD